jgi:putative salt-induced outer membrane protein YdiY
MNTARIGCIALALVMAAASVEADVVVLKNGDRVTGTFLNVRGTNLTIQAEVLGNLTIPVADVAAVFLSEIVTVIVRGQPTIGGRLELGPFGNWQVTDDNEITQTIGAAAIDTILPVARYQSIVEHEARPWQDWTGTVNLGYSVQRGNQQTNTFSSSIDARREQPPAPIFESHGRTNVHLTVLLSNATEAEASIGSNTFSTSVRQDILFSPGSFVFGIVQFDHVGTEGLSLRQTYGGGSGYDLKLSRLGTLSLIAGLTLVSEEFSTGGNEQTAQLLLGEKLRWQLTPRVRLDHSINAYPNLTNQGQYHFDTRTALDIKLTNRFSLNTSLIDLYLTNPAPGSRANNFALTTGITTTF